MKIAVITYQAPHRKTQDLLLKLVTYYPESSIHVFGLPWLEKPQTRQILYPHRPPITLNAEPEKFCKCLPGVRYTPVKNQGDLGASLAMCMPDARIHTKYRSVLIAGAGILNFPGMKEFNIINTHPGHLPHVPGLDALKWAILYGQPIGVTTHLINEEIDDGFLIERKFVPVFFEDCFYSVAMRQYEMEVEMLARSPSRLRDMTGTENLYNPGIKPHKRMPLALEVRMMVKFEQLRNNSPCKIQTK